MEAFAVVVEELIVPILDMGALDLLGGLVALRGLHAVADPAHVDLGGRCAFAGMEAFRSEHDVELAVDLKDIALADGAGDNFHGSCFLGWAKGMQGSRPEFDRTILILADFASIFP